MNRRVKGPLEVLATASSFCVADLCCGLGGMSLATRTIGMVPVAGVDTNAHALKTYKKNFEGAEAICGSVSSAETVSKLKICLKPHLVSGKQLFIVSGPPCQGFSIAGPRKASDERNEVLVAVAQTIVELGPTAALVENVAALTSERHTTIRLKFEKILADGGYRVHSEPLDAINFGVAQRRRRALFFITPFDLDWLEIRSRLTNLQVPAKVIKDVLSDLPLARPRPISYVDEEEEGIVHPQNGTVFYNHYSMIHSPAVIKKITLIECGKGPLSYRRLDPEKHARTVLSGHRAPPAHYSEGRSITVREAARLQCLPDNFRIYGTFGEQMQQVSNAVPPPLTEAALNALLHQLPAHA